MSNSFEDRTGALKNVRKAETHSLNTDVHRSFGVGTAVSDAGPSGQHKVTSGDSTQIQALPLHAAGFIDTSSTAGFASGELSPINMIPRSKSFESLSDIVHDSDSSDSDLFLSVDPPSPKDTILVPQRERLAQHSSETPNLLELIQWSLPGPNQLFKYFAVDELLELRVICQTMSNIVKDYVLHDLIPNSHISFGTTRFIDGRGEMDLKQLYPVIKRV